MRRRPFPPLVLTAAIALVAIALTPSALWAWSPGTHVLIGEAVLKSAQALLPPTIAALLRAYPFDFLYGSIAADTSFAKRYARIGRHCHFWHVGDEILDKARDDRLRAFGYGYLSHLAADVVAHNHFVPHQLAITSTTSGIGHAYWESRFETHAGDEWAGRARTLIEMDHNRADGHLDKILSPTLFSTPTNRRIFRGMVRAADLDSWQRVMTMAAEYSRWPLHDATVKEHLELSFDYVVDFLNRGEQASARHFDPSGELALREAKKVRKLALDRGGEREARAEAAEQFGLPHDVPGFTAKLEAPLYVSVKDN